MKKLNLLVAGVLGFTSVSAIAHEKLPEKNLSQIAVKNNLRADFFGLNDEVYIKTDTGIKQAQTLSAGDMLVMNNGEPVSTVTGKLVVKLAEGVDSAQFATLYNLNVSWKNMNNLVIYSANENVDLVSLLKQLQADKQVVRVKLDKTVAKHSPM